MDDTQTSNVTEDYVVTPAAGPYVAGRRAEPGERLTLTEPQARYELMLGSIEPAPAKKSAGLKMSSNASSNPVEG